MLLVLFITIIVISHHLYSIIHIAASQGDVEQMKHFLKLMSNQGGDVNCRDAFRKVWGS